MNTSARVSSNLDQKHIQLKVLLQLEYKTKNGVKIYIVPVFFDRAIFIVFWTKHFINEEYIKE